MVMFGEDSRVFDRDSSSDRRSPRRLLGWGLCTLLLVLTSILSPVPAAAAPALISPPAPMVLEVSAALLHTCVVTTDGDADCWGPQGTATPPAGAGPFTAISSAQTLTCGLQTDRTIVCWSEGGGQGAIAGEFTAVSVGNGFGCALEVGQDIACWGSNESGQAPAHLAGPFVGLDAGDGHACAIKADASIVCWGANASGQAPARVAGSFAAVSAGPSSTCAIRTDGDLACWGDNSTGQAPTKVTGPFRVVSSGAFLTCAVREGGAAICWGRTVTGGPSPEEVAGEFRTVSTSGYHTCLIGNDDRLSCYGDEGAMPTAPGTPVPDPRTRATEGVPYERGIAVTSTSPVELTIKGTLPAGLTLAPTEWGAPSPYVLTGIPTKRGTYRFTVVATNLFGASELPLVLRVLPPPGYDVNGDGIVDLPVGVPGQNKGSKADSGQVTVLLGAADGTYGRKGAQIIDQEVVGQRSETGDRFGAVITTGEITGDTYVDLIIAAPGEDKSAGQVVVVTGSAKGWRADGGSSSGRVWPGRQVPPRPATASAPRCP